MPDVWILFLVATAGAIAFTALAFRRKDSEKPGRGQKALLIVWLIGLAMVALFGLLTVLEFLVYIGFV